MYACLSDWMAVVEAGRDPFLQVGEQLAVKSQVHDSLGPVHLPGFVSAPQNETHDVVAQDGRELLVTHVAGSPRTLLERAETAVYHLRQRLQ